MRKVIAIDFDGCLCENAWPEIGTPHMEVIDAALQAQRKGAALVLWTCRNGDLLASAVEWCRERGLFFDAVNENLPERLEYYGGDPRKISADEYWDDCAVHIPVPPNTPLTLEELRKMDGEPVYLYFVDGGEWVLLRKFDGKIFITHRNTICSPVNLVFRCGGKIYRRKPEEVET